MKKESREKILENERTINILKFENVRRSLLDLMRKLQTLTKVLVQNLKTSVVLSHFKNAAKQQGIQRSCKWLTFNL